MNCKSAVTVLLAILTAFCTSASNIRRVTAEYIYHLPENIAPDQAKEIAEQRAKAQAIADEFGTIVTQSSTVFIDTQEEASTTDFISIGGSELKGEWIEDISTPVFEFITDGAELALKVSVCGLIREIEGACVPFEFKILRNGTSDSCEADRFMSGDEMFMSFNSPSAGYVAVYLIDAERNVFCLLPYQSQSEGFFRTKANRPYIFFHPRHADGVVPEAVDELLLDTEMDKERNRILTIFSPNRFFKAADSQSDSSLPRNMSYKNFQKWLSGLKKRDADLTVSEKAITIISKK